MKCALAALLVLQCLTPAYALVVCADPNNLPFSNRAGEGFENKLVRLLARKLHTDVEYVWWAQRRGFARHTLTPVGCDLWPGVARGIKGLITTRPYYRSTYVFVTRAGNTLGHLSLDDPRLRHLTIGVQLVGYEAMNTPPALELAERGLTENVRGFLLFGDYTQPNPPASIVDAVAAGSIDVALVWGPTAGYFASRAAAPLRLEPVAGGKWPMAYDIAVGVRRDERGLRDRLDSVLASERVAVEALLTEYHVPQVTPTDSVGTTVRR